MVYLISVVGGLFLAGFGISRVSKARSAKPSVQKLFGAN